MDPKVLSLQAKIHDKFTNDQHQQTQIFLDLYGLFL